MRKKIEWLWEKLDENTFRAKVIGGWLILHTNHIVITDSKKRDGVSQSESMTFVCDRDHEWVIVEPFNPADDGQFITLSKVNAADFEG